MLEEVQHATEKKLFQQRLEYRRKVTGNYCMPSHFHDFFGTFSCFADEKVAFDKQYQTQICDASKDPDHVIRLTAKLDREREEMLETQKEEQKQFDCNLVLQLDQKVMDQQATLEKAGVPGFYVTNNPTDIQVQMYLLQFIKKLRQ